MPAISKRLDTLIGSTFISIASGIGITLSLAPFHYWPLGILSAGCLFLLIQGKNIRQAAIFGWLFGLGLFGSGASWVYVSIHDFAYTSVENMRLKRGHPQERTEAQPGDSSDDSSVARARHVSS